MNGRSVSRRAFLGGVAGGSAALAAACGGTAAPSSGGKSPIEGVKPAGRIQWSFWAVSQEQADNTLARVKDFNAAHPDVQVDALWVLNGDYRAKIISLVSAGTPPDCTQVDAYDMAAFVAQKLLQPMEPYMKGDKNFKLDSFVPGSFLEDHHVFKGAYFAVPNSAESPRVIFYNKAKWADAGLPLPNALDDQGKWNWDAFVEHMTKVTKGDGPSKQFGIRAELGVHPEPHSWIYLNGGRTLSEDHKTFLGDQKETLDALQFQADLIFKHKVAPAPGDDLGQGDPFLTGRLAAKLTGIWDAAPLFTRPDFDYGIAPLPKGPKGMRKTVVKPNALTIPVGVTGQKAAASWELIKFVSGPQYQKALIDVGQVMTNQKELQDYFLQHSPVRNAKVFTDAYANKEVVPIPLIPKWNDYRTIVDEEFGKVRSGGQGVQVAVGNIKSRTADLLKNG